MKKTICVIGKGHSGTGFFTEHFHKSGVFVGENDNLNKHFDKAPYDTIYEIMSYPVGYEYENRLDHIPQFVEMAKPVINRYGHTNKDLNTEWDFTKMIKDEIPSKVINNMTKYLKDLDEHDGELVGWKLSESNLIYPWLVRLYPEWYYVHIVRDVRDILSRQELTDTVGHTNLFNIRGYKSHMNKRPGRNHIVQAINWKYQLDIVKSINAPNYMRITLEDLVMDQDRVLGELSDFVGFKVAKVKAHENVVESWRERDRDMVRWAPMDWNNAPDGFSYSFLNDYMEEFKYPDWPYLADEVKSSTVKFSEDEMTKLQELQNSYQQKQVEFGQLRVQKLVLSQQLDALEEREKQTEQEYVNVQQEEQQLVNELNEKYGPGSLDPQTGEFTPVEPTESAE